MRALVQRVSQATVTVRSDQGVPEEVGRIGRGLCAFVGVTQSDDLAGAQRLAAKLWNLRIFPDDAGAMNRSVADSGGAVLVVSQFTLYGSTDRGRRPSFVAAAGPEQAEPLVAAVVAALEQLGAAVATGRFRTHMEVSLRNDGPITLMIET